MRGNPPTLVPFLVKLNRVAFGYTMGAIKVDLAMFDCGGTTVESTNGLTIAMTAIRMTGQKSSHSEAARVLFHTIQFFFIRAQKCLAL